MLLKIYQLSVAFLTMSAIIYQDELHNGYAVGFVGFLAAWFATAIPIWIIDRVKRLLGHNAAPERLSEMVPEKSAALNQLPLGSETVLYSEKRRLE